MIPLRQSVTQVARAAHQVTPPSILLVSVPTDERAEYAEAFGARGFCTLLAATTETACRLAAEVPPLAVVMTVELSVCEDGVPLLRRLKADQRLRGVPAVIIAGRTDYRTVIERVGRELFVARAASADELARFVTALLDGSPESATFAAQPA